MHGGWDALGVVAVCSLFGCDPNPSAKPSADTAVAPTNSSPTQQRGPAPAASLYPKEPLPRVRKLELQAESTTGVVTVMRPLLSKVTPTDGLHVTARWLVGEKAPADAKSQGRWDFDLDRLADSLRVRIVGPGGETTLTALPEPSRQWFDYRGNGVEIIVTGDAIHVAGKDRKWNAPKADLFATPGKYVIHVSGSLSPESGKPVPFEGAAVEMEVVEASTAFRALAELEAIAQKAAPQRAPGLTPLGTRTLEDEQSNRWFWFTSRMGGGSGQEWNTHVLVSPSGDVLAYDERYRFSCISEGSLIATPSGSIAIESLRVGDVVVGYDIAREREVPTTVRDIRSARVTGLVRIGQLRVTSEHPVFANGRWIAASELGSGDTLLGRHGARFFVDDVARVDSDQVVYDVSVDPPNDFFADGVLVHNKTAPQALKMDWWDWLFDRPSEPGWRERSETPR